MRRLLSCAVGAWLAAPVCTAWADDAAPEGGSVSTADIRVEADAAKENAKYESQSTTIITAEDIAKKQAKSVEDIIFDETGMTRTVDAMGRVGLSIRGAEPRHTLILVDGRPVMGDFAKYTGQGDELQRLGTENVARIEIIRGAASAKYGADAIGGVVNVITKEASKTAGLQVNLEGRRARGDGDLFPFANGFLRADSGQIGKFRFDIYGGKRDIMPAYSKNSFGGVLHGGTSDGTRVRNSLRYYGDIKDIGFTAAYVLAALACNGLIAGYLSAVLGSASRALTLGGILALAYAVLYLLLQSQEYTLLAGSLLLFAALAATMYGTRNFDWYNLKAKKED